MQFKHLFLITTVLFFSWVTAKADTTGTHIDSSNSDISDYSVGKYNIGMGAGFVTGVGISYRQWGGKYGFQINCAPFYNEDEFAKKIWLSLGVTGLRMIREAKFVNLFGYVGVHYFYDYYRSKRNMFSDDSSSVIPIGNNSVYKTVFIGGGPGIDIHFWKLSLNIMFGLKLQTDLDSFVGSGLTSETALYYSF